MMLRDPPVFEDEYLPRRVEHRDGAIDQLVQAFAPAAHGHGARDVLIAGPSGVGKTLLARHLLRRLERQAAVTTAHVPCLGATTGDVLRAILCAHPRADDPAHNTSVEACRDRLRAVATEPVVVVLDEADGLPATDALDVLAGLPACSSVAIVHDPDAWLDRLDREHGRHWSGTRVRLDRYGVDELADILDTRAELGLAPGVVDRAQLERIADETAGYARRGIQALRAAAELAREREHDTIRDADIDDAYDRARRRIRASNLRSLPVHHHVLYELIRRAGDEGIQIPELNDRYERVAERAYRGVPQQPIGTRSRSAKLDKLAAYDLITVDGAYQNQTFRATDLDLASEFDDVVPDADPSLQY